MKLTDEILTPFSRPLVTPVSFLNGLHPKTNFLAFSLDLLSDPSMARNLAWTQLRFEQSTFC